MKKTNYKIYDELESAKLSYDSSVNILETDSANSLGALTFLQKLKIRMIEFYSNSKYLNGMKDELGRDKPFFNIINGVIDTENAAKDLDTKDLEVVSIDGNHVHESFLLGKEVKIWMNQENYGKSLNDQRDIHSRYGSLLVKKYTYTDEDGKKRLCVQLPAWKNVWNNQIDILKNPIVELHWMLPSEMLKMKAWHQDQVKEAIKFAKKNPKNGGRVPVYEMRGEFPRSYFKETQEENFKLPEDDFDYSYQCYYLSGEIGGKKFNLYEEDDTERVYKYLARKPKPGRAFGVGVPEEGEEAQVWTNDAVLKQFRAMEYTSKVVVQTPSKKLKGRNMLTETDDGTVLETEENKPITAVPLLPAGGLGQYQTLITQWYDQFEKSSSAYGGQRGAQAKSHTPYRSTALQLQQSQAVFVQLRQEFGLFQEEIFNDWVLPFLAEQLTKEHVLASDFTPEELKEIDTNFATYQANKAAAEKILAGEIVYPDQYDAYLQLNKEMMQKNKAHRFLEIPKNYYKNLKAKVYVLTTGEQKDKAQVMESIANIMMIYAKNPQALQDPVLSLLFKEAVQMSGIGISSVQLMAAINEQAKMMAQQQQMQAQAGPGTPGTNNMPMAQTEAAVNKEPAYAPAN